MSRRIAILLLAAVLPLPLAAQQVVTFTESQGGNGNRPLGYPVPVPVASLEAVDGFRDYASLEARLQALALDSEDLGAHQVGTTQGHGRPVWAYTLGDPDSSDHEGSPEAAFFINAGIHAREWGTQEISTWLVERMMAGADDGGLVRWLLDTTTLVIIPVHNVDGFLQTQRYPRQALVGADPRYPSAWPRDGRMRRKNMRGVDELLQTTGDHLGGIDLNRNHPPFWATDVPDYSSSNPADLTYHGSGPHSEAESLALRQALLLAPPERLRMGVDIHSFAQVFYSSNTGQARLNAIQAALLSRISAHHMVAAAPAAASSGPFYQNVHDPKDQGGGLLAEYLAYEFLVPAWTLEIEPKGNLGGTQYGGTNEGHAGFILPAAEVRRVREGWAESHLLAFYYMAGAPYLEQVRVVDEASGATVLDARWQRQGAVRQRNSSGSGILQPGRSYRAELVFSKPMRIAGPGGAPAAFPGQFVTASPQIVLHGAGGQQQQLDTAAGSWMSQGRRWAFDRFEFHFDAPDTAGTWTLQVDALDAVGHRLDADPSTPVDWVQGAWSGLENSLGSQGDTGGVDASTQLSVANSEIQLRSAPSVVGEGELAQVVLERSGGAGPVSTRLRLAGADPADPLACPFLDPSPATWQAGESGARTLATCVADDLVVQGTRTLELLVEVAGADGAFQPLVSVAVEVLDNDGEGAPVLRASPGRLGRLLSTLDPQGPQPVELVLDQGEYALSVGPGLTCDHNVLRGPLVVHGNHARIRHAAGSSDCSLLAARGEGVVELRQLTLLGRRSDGDLSAGVVLQGSAPLLLREVILDDGGPAGGPTVAASGAQLAAYAGAVLERTALTGLVRSDATAASLHGETILRSSALRATGADTLVHLASGATATITGSTLLAGAAGDHALLVDGSASATLSSSLLQHAATGTLCDGPGQRTSLGGNVASDASCGEAAGDRIPSRPALPQTDALTGAPFPTGDAMDVGGDCPPLDIRGAPRPQSMDGDATPLCDAGAIELGISPYRGLWIPDRSGHGVDMHTAGRMLFLTWYTYHPDGTPAAYQASAALTGPQWRASLDSARRREDGSIERFSVGDIELDFASDTEATLRWRIDEGQQSGEEGLHAYLFAAGEPRVEATGTWYDPTDSGWGLTVTRRGAITGLVLYYYDSAGTLRWALAQGGDGDVLELPLFGYTGFCPDCDASANPAQAAPAGTLRVQFLTPRRARAWLDAGHDGQPRFQRSSADLVPLSDPVDNRRAAAAAQSPASPDAAL